MSKKKNQNEEFYAERTVYDQYFSVLLNPPDLVGASKQTSSYGNESFFPWLAFAPKEKKKNEKKKPDISETTFAIHIDVHHFTAAEMEIHIKGHDCSVVANHGPREDEHGVVSRSFTRNFKLPDNVDLDTAQTRISSDGVLTFQVKYKTPGSEPKSTTPAPEGSTEAPSGQEGSSELPESGAAAGEVTPAPTSAEEGSNAPVGEESTAAPSS